MTVARFNLILKRDRDNHELIEKAKKMYPDGKLKPGEILHDFKGTKYDLDQYINGHMQDQINEKFPIAAYRRTSIKHGNLSAEQIAELKAMQGGN